MWPSELRSAIFHHGSCRPKEAKLSVVRRSIGNAKRVGQRCVAQPEELRSGDQNTREYASDGRRGNASIASMKIQSRVATEETFWRKYFLRTINIVMTLTKMGLALRGHREQVANGNCHGGNFLALVAMQTRFDPVCRIYFNPRLEQRSI